VVTEQQIVDLRKQFYREQQSAAGKQGAKAKRENSPQRNHAKKVVARLQGQIRGKSVNAIANLVLNKWNPDSLAGIVDCPVQKTVRKYIKDFWTRG
jgi:DNA-binding protein Fis